MRRISTGTLKANGFRQVNSMQAYKKDGVIVSYGLIVAIGTTSADGYHNYSTTTSRQVTVASGYSSAERKKMWNIVDEETFEKMANKVLKGLKEA